LHTDRLSELRVQRIREHIDSLLGVHGDREGLDLLTLDRPGDPHDKNFAYYRKQVGPALQGFFGSPNLRHSGTVRAVAFSKDGKWVVSGSGDNTLKLWDMATGREVRAFAGHAAGVLACALSAD